MVKEIPLHNSELVAIVDDEDFDLVSKYRWYLQKKRHTQYARAFPWDGTRSKTILMHRLILNPPAGHFSDHINRNGLDNRRSNLRSATRTQNGANIPKGQGVTLAPSSQYKGVCWDKNQKKWQATIKHDRRTFYLGRFSSEEEAARAYDRDALARFGEFAFLNFPNENKRKSA